MEAQNPRPVTILMADDDADDRMMAERALRECRVINDLRFVKDGRELMEYLRHEGDYADPHSAPWPGLILLDLNMPEKDGRQALNEIKADRCFRCIPVIVLTTSHAEEDIIRSYDLGVNSFITKPVSFSQLVEALKVMGEYWLKIVKLPPEPKELDHGRAHTPAADR